MLDESIIAAGKALRIWNGGVMRRRFQFGHVFERGKRRRVWVGRWVKPVLVEGKLKRILASRVIGAANQMTKSQATRILQEWLRPLNEGNFVPVEMTQFGDFYERWERDLLPVYRESTREFYRDTARRWVRPYFEGWKLEEIKPAEVQRFINLFAGKYSRSVLKNVRATLGCMFRAAVTWRYVRENPCEGLRLPPGKGVHRAKVLLPEMIERLVERLAEPYKTMVMLAATSGLRESELFGLQGQDFDYQVGVVRVARSVYRRRVGDTKTAQSKREIPLLPEVLAAVATLNKNDGEWLFAGPKGGFLRPDEVMAEAIRPAALELGLEEIAWRSFRRSAESAMHNAGLPMKVQQALMGHTNPNTTLLYAEADPRLVRQAAEGLGKIIFPKLSQVASHVASDLAN